MATDSFGDTYTVGVDFGTLSGRAVVVRVSDGAELGSAVSEYRHGVMDAALAASGARLPPDWALQVPSDYIDVLREAVPRAVAAAGVDPARVVGIGTDFTACTMVPTLADGTPLNEVPGYGDRPHAYVKLWRHHAAQPQADRINELAARRAEPWLPRYGGLISSEWEFAKGLQLLEEDPDLYARMDRWVEAADWIVWQLTDRYVRKRLHGRVQGHPAGRAVPGPGLPRRAQPRLRRLRRRQAAPGDRPVGRPGGPVVRAGGGLDRAARGHRGGGRQRGRARHRCGDPGGAPRPAGRHHGYLDLPHRELRPAGRGTGDVRSRRRRDRRRPLRVRGGAVRCRRHLRLVRRHPGTGVLPRAGGRGGAVDPPVPDRADGAPAGRRPWPRGAGLAQRQPFRARRPRPVRTADRRHARHPPRGDLPRAAGGDRVRYPSDRRSLHRERHRGERVHRRRRPGGQRDPHADLQRRAGHAAVHDPQRAGAGAGLGDPCRGRRRRLSRRAGGERGDGQGAARAYAPDPVAARAYERLYAEYVALHDYFGRGGNEVMHRLAALRRKAFHEAGSTALAAGP